MKPANTKSVNSIFGISMDVLNIFDEQYERRSINSVLFKPYKSSSDVFFRAASIATAPIGFSIVTAACVAAGTLFAVKAIVDLVTLNRDSLKRDLGNVLGILLATGISVFAATISPLINAVGILAGGAATLSHMSKGSADMHLKVA